MVVNEIGVSLTISKIPVQTTVKSTFLLYGLYWYLTDSERYCDTCKSLVDGSHGIRKRTSRLASANGLTFLEPFARSLVRGLGAIADGSASGFALRSLSDRLIASEDLRVLTRSI